MGFGVLYKYLKKVKHTFLSEPVWIEVDFTVWIKFLCGFTFSKQILW